MSESKGRANSCVESSLLQAQGHKRFTITEEATEFTGNAATTSQSSMQNLVTDFGTTLDSFAWFVWLIPYEFAIASLR